MGYGVGLYLACCRLPLPPRHLSLPACPHKLLTALPYIATCSPTPYLCPPTPPPPHPSSSFLLTQLKYNSFPYSSNQRSIRVRWHRFRLAVLDISRHFGAQGEHNAIWGPCYVVGGEQSEPRQLGVLGGAVRPPWEM